MKNGSFVKLSLSHSFDQFSLFFMKLSKDHSCEIGQME